ncbi:MAG: MarR family transcriptional regulator [Telmatospirillum sp.]|nr:MarR family transcriptional regulator [Telmatospirillum sp.]
MTTREPLYTLENYTPRRNVMRSLVDLGHLAAETLNRRVAGLGITGSQWVVLMRIASGVGSSASELCRAVQYDRGAMTRMLDRLEKAGLIERERSAEDRRVVNLRLTQAGRDLYPRLVPAAIDTLNQSLEGFSHKEVETLMGFLDRIMANHTGR